MAFFSQSGALGTAILDWAAANHVGFSAFVSVGSMADVDFGDLIDYFGADTHTSSIILYVESITDARKFMSAARHFAKSKPIIVVKSGRTARSALAAASHTGAIAGDDTLYSAVFRRAGVVRVDEIEDLFDASEALSRVSSPRGPRLGIVTNAGGPGVMASDCLLGLGGELAEITPETDAKLQAALPGFAARGNPVDVAGDADAAPLRRRGPGPHRRPQLRRRAGHPHAAGDERPHGHGQALVDVARTHQLKPLLTSFMGEIKVAEGVEIFRHAHVPTFSTPEDAVRAYMYMYQYTRNLQNLYETPADILPDFEPARDEVKKIFIRVARDGRSILSEPEAKAVLEAYQIPVVQDGGRHQRRGVRQGGGGHRLPRGHQDPQPRHHPQERRRRHRPQRALRTRGGQPVHQDHGARAREAARRQDHRRDRAGHEPRRLRGHPGLQEGPHLRPGPHVRHGRHRRRALPRRGPRLPAAQPGAGQEHDPEHEGLPAARRATAARSPSTSSRWSRPW